MQEIDFKKLIVKYGITYILVSLIDAIDGEENYIVKLRDDLEIALQDYLNRYNYEQKNFGEIL